MKKIKWVYKITCLIIISLLTIITPITIKAEGTTYNTQLNGKILYIDSKELLNEYLQGSYNNQNNFKVAYWEIGNINNQNWNYITNLYYYDYDWYDGRNSHTIMFPSTWIFFDYYEIRQDYSNDPIVRLFNADNQIGYPYVEDLYFISGIINLKNKLSISQQNISSWILEIEQGDAYFPFITESKPYTLNCLYSAREEANQTYTHGEDPRIDGTIVTWYNNTFTFWTTNHTYETDTDTPRYTGYENGNGNYEYSMNNNYIIFGGNYVYKSFIDAIVTPNYINERGESMVDIFVSIFDTVFEYISSYLNFTILGVNIFTILLGIISILLLVKIIKMFI